MYDVSYGYTYFLCMRTSSMKIIWILLLILISGTLFSVVYATQEDTVDRKFFETYKNWAHNTIKLFQDYAEGLKIENESLHKKIHSLEIELTKVTFSKKQLENELKIVKTASSERFSEMKQLEDNLEQYEEFVNEVKEWAEEDAKKPRTTIYNQHIHWEVSDSKDNRYTWSMPIETYENLVKYPDPQNILRLQNTATGEIYTVLDHTKFVRSSFAKIIDDVYDNSNGNVDFVHEVWYIVSQLTTYSYDIGEDPRWALETLSRGGDCEDTAILIADMLRSSQHTKNWEIQLVYFDAYSPNNPETMNHVAVNINDGENNYLIESTAKDNPYAWSDGVSGWYFDV